VINAFKFRYQIQLAALQHGSMPALLHTLEGAGMGAMVRRCSLTPGRPGVYRPWFPRSRLKYDEPPSKFALNFNLRRYALEMFALGLKATGAYMSRTLSYAGAEFETCNCPLSDELRVMYDRSCEFWQMLYRVFQESEVGRMAAHCKMGGAVRWAQFWSAHQRFFRQMLLNAKAWGLLYTSTRPTLNPLLLLLRASV